MAMSLQLMMLHGAALDKHAALVCSSLSIPDANLKFILPVEAHLTQILVHKNIAMTAECFLLGTVVLLFHYSLVVVCQSAICVYDCMQQHKTTATGGVQHSNWLLRQLRRACCDCDCVKLDEIAILATTDQKCMHAE